MLISRHWLQKFFEEELPPAEKLAEALTFHAFEIDGIEKVGEDDVLDVKVTPNRGADCLGYRGIAKELSAILNIPLANDPLAKKPSLTPQTKSVQVLVDNAELCPRYIAGFLKEVKVGPSPHWLRRNLEAMGSRSINNVVDATNFVMFNLGQPLHAFDAGELMSRDGVYVISVRTARAGETLHALDEKEYRLTDSMLAIVDANADVPIGIAGVKGGTASGISEKTTNIILESANFNGPSVRKTAQALKLRTDASARFEQEISPEFAAYGMQAAVELIQKLAGGELQGFVDVFANPPQEKRIELSVEQVNKVLGTGLSGAEVADAFTRLGFAYKEEGGVFEVVVPFERVDLALPEDLSEEVGRIVGYEKIPAQELPAASKAPEINQHFAAAERMREELVAQGYSEVYTSVFAEKGERAVLNKVDSVRPFLRASLLPGLEQALEKNKPHKDLLGLSQIKLFEIGTVWPASPGTSSQGGKEVVMLGTVSEKEKAQEKLLERLDMPQYENLPVSSAERYQAFSRFPYIVRDIALWTPGETDTEELRKQIKELTGPLCTTIYLFDRFEKEGRVSLAYRLIFQSFERTLTEDEANKAMEKVSSTLAAKGFEIR